MNQPTSCDYLDDLSERLEDLRARGVWPFNETETIAMADKRVTEAEGD